MAFIDIENLKERLFKEHVNLRFCIYWDEGFCDHSCWDVLIVYVEVLRYFTLAYWCVCAQSHPTFASPWTVDHQAPLFLEFSRQEYQNGLLFPTPEDLPDQRIKPRSPASTTLAGSPGDVGIFLYGCYRE